MPSFMLKEMMVTVTIFVKFDFECTMEKTFCADVATPLKDIPALLSAP